MQCIPRAISAHINAHPQQHAQVEDEIEAITPLHAIGALLLNTSSLKASLKARLRSVCMFD